MVKHRKRRIFCFVFWTLLVLLMIAPTIQAAAFAGKTPVATVTLKETKAVIRWNKRSNMTGYKVFSCNASGRSLKRIALTKKNKIVVRNLEPVGRAMYVWGGGWNKEDTDAT